VSTLVLAAGGSKPYEDAGYPYPKELAELDGQPLIEHVLTRLGSLTREPLVVVVDSHADKKFCIADVVRLVVPTAASIRAGATSGALCSALLAIGDIRLDQDLLIVNGDQFLDVELDQIVADWRRSDLDAATVVFDATHPRWSYVRVDADGLVVEAAEKRPISRLATAGTYWFRRATDFFDAAQTMILQSAAHGEAFFICPALNELVLAGKRIGITRIERDAYHSFKYPDELEDYVREQSRLSGTRS
jgi:dTDP-glucose pyrophosphorylase